MNRYLFLLLLFFCSAGYAQYSNDWVDHDKTYYKFKIANDSLYHISQATLNNLGLGNIPAEQFQLWRNGEEQVLYTSKPSGILEDGDYLEFWGRMNDGKIDKKLYRDPDYQLSDHFSIQTDTASYYLTVNPQGNNLRYTNADNNVTGTTLSPELYFMNRRSHYFRTRLSPGNAIPAGGIYVYSSSYDMGEGWVSTDVLPNRPLSVLLSGLNIYNGGPAGTLDFAMVGSVFNTRSIKVKYNNTYIYEQELNYFNYVKKKIENIPQSLNVHTDYVRFYFESSSPVSTDRCVVSNFTFTYPSKWNFNNQNTFSFEMPASLTGNYIVIDNFKYDGVAPVLLDIVTRKRYTADISTAGKVKFVLPPSAAPQQFRLINVSPIVTSNVSAFEKRNFVNYELAINQGDYLIISNKLLFKDNSGKNQVDLYAQYRNSVNGGGYHTKIIDVEELIEQFAYGIKKHPSAVKEFIAFATRKFAVRPKFVFLVGKGVTYDEYAQRQNSIYADRLNLVPTFGYPASDVLLVSPYGSAVPSVPVGRLSAVSGDEVGNYLEKMKEYETKQRTGSQTTEDRLWMKNAIQIIGGKDNQESIDFRNYMNGYKAIIVDTFYGANVELFAKTSNSSVQLLRSQKVEEYFREGLSFISYFGHSSASVLDFNLNDPQAYANPGKYPFFMVSGCTAGNNYTMDSTRILQENRTISESFVLSPNRGSIAFYASTHFGLPPQLNEYNMAFYKDAFVNRYGLSAGEHQQNAIKIVGGENPNIDYFTRADYEEMTLHGDPALTFNLFDKPDYIIEDRLIKIDPSFVSISENKFVVQAKVYNIGKAIADSVNVTVKRTFPDGKNEEIYKVRLRGINYQDSIRLEVPVISTRDKGLNKLTITIDSDDEVDELSEANNIIIKEVYIYEDEARPAFPAEFGIVNQANQKLYVSTANPFSGKKAYVMEIDTTLLFNSPLKRTSEIVSAGGIIMFEPGISFSENGVYYWRVAVKPASGLPEDYHWNQSSFVYLPNSEAGFNQSHYYQHLASDTNNIKLKADRKWAFAELVNLFEVRNGVWTTGTTQNSEMLIEINGTDFTRGICGISKIVFNVVDPVSLKPMLNNSTGRFGSEAPCGTNAIANFQYSILDPAKRKAAMNFLRDSIPDNYLVVVRNIASFKDYENTYSADWQSDTTLYGSGNSLYHALRENGFTALDSFNKPRAFVFMYQNKNPDFEPGSVFTKGVYDKVSYFHPVLTVDTVGTIASPKFGPAVAWKEMHWRGTSVENPVTDKPVLDVIGYDKNDASKVLFSVDLSKQDLDISSIDANEYPYIQLKMNNLDKENLTPYQLSYWRVNYVQTPEGALAPNILYSARDTLEQGEPLHFSIAFKNISTGIFDSLKVKLSVIDKNNVTVNLPVARYKPLISGDTILFRYAVETRNLSGANTLSLDFNPDNDQPELYHFNNFLYKDFFVKADLVNPLLDVTFDGVHILNSDIVSARPHILIKLKDENKFMALRDTSVLKVQLRYPDGSMKDYRFDNDTLRFTPPAAGASENVATIDFNPQLAGNDDEYELIVSGKDAVGNKAGELDYHVKFRVISKPMISNMLNYPNPFTTSTAFVFTVTGSVVPQNVRIQVLTVTGKVVREITKEELGPLHIGRNITEFKWDGTDMYGQKLANGVYLYRVLTNLEGKSLDKFKRQGDNTDKYFTKGYGKMYLMR